MSVMTISSHSIRPVLPCVGEAAVTRAEPVRCRPGSVGLAPHHPGPAPAHVLLLHDAPSGLSEQLRRTFPSPDYRVQVAGSGPAGMRCLSVHSPDVVVLDLDLSGSAGLEAYRQIRRVKERIPVIFFAAAGDADSAIEAMKQGAYDFLFKPVEPSVLHRVVGEALDVARHLRAPAMLADTALDPDVDGAIIGSCPAMCEVYKAIGRVAARNVPVLITGETGTGKELVARALYEHSPRAGAPFLALNCAAIPEPLLESELLGHEKGAFTGADRQRIGKFEQCHGGILFLDEVGDMPLATQAKVLRLLQDQAFERVGGNETIRTDVRLIAATHRDLEARSAQGMYRPDLYYRLGVYTIHLPPLRDRGDDLPVLVRHYVRRFGRELGREVREVAPEAIERLRAYSWPGNVRELQSVLKQALLRSTGPVLVPAFLPELAPRRAVEPAAVGGVGPRFEGLIEQRLRDGSQDLYDEARRELDRFLLPWVLRSTGGSQLQAAKVLGLARGTLRIRMRELGLAVTKSVDGEEDSALIPE